MLLEYVLRGEVGPKFAGKTVTFSSILEKQSFLNDQSILEEAV